MTLIQYGRADLKLFFNVTQPSVINFGKSARNKIHRIINNAVGLKKKHRAGWRHALRKQDIRKMSIPIITTANIRSLMNKIPELTFALQAPENSQLGIIMLQETWLHHEVNDDVLSIDGFKHHRVDRKVGPRNRGGGVITYVRQSWSDTSKVVFSYSDNLISCVSIRCKPKFLTGYRFLVLTNIYIPPSIPAEPYERFINSLTENLIDYCDDSLLVVGGDFNKCDHSFLTLCGLTNIVNFPTRENSYLDLTFVNDRNCFVAQRRAPIGTTDHATTRLLPCIYNKQNLTSKRRRERKVTRRNISSENINRLKEMVASTDFTLFHHHDISTHSEHLTEYLNFCLETCCPMETILLRTDRFSSPTLKRLRRSKEYAYKTNNSDRVKQLTGMIKAEIRRLNRLYIDTVTGSTCSRDLWKVLKKLSGTDNKTYHNSINVDIINNLNREFIVNSDTTNTSETPDLSVDSNHRTDVEIDAQEVIQTLKNLNSTKSGGPDGLSPIVLKHCAQHLAEPLTTLYNQCLMTQTIPENWKTARITPVPKRGSNKFRPIACTSVNLKVFERLLLPKISDQAAIIDDEQYAYKKNRSTLDAVATLVHTALDALDKKQGAFRYCFLDFSNAFNCVDRNILLSMIQQAGVSQTLVQTLTDYFKNRRQFTKFRQTVSETLTTDFGVLQGAILSPLLFSLYTSDLPQCTSALLLKYADDVTIGINLSSKNHNDALQSYLNMLNDWSCRRNLSLNVSKCADMVFSMKRGMNLATQLNDIPALAVGGNEVGRVSEFKYLGVMITSDTKWHAQTKSTFLKVRKMLHVLRRLRSFSIPGNLLIRFVNACIIPLWTYCSPVIFPGMSQKDFSMMARSISAIARCSGQSAANLSDFLVNQHMESCKRFAARILQDDHHPLFGVLSGSISTSSTRTTHRLMKTRTTAYKQSVLPNLVRILLDPDKVMIELRSKLP